MPQQLKLGIAGLGNAGQAVLRDLSAVPEIALGAVAVFYDEDGPGRVRDAHIGVIGVANRPLRIKQAEALLNGRAVTGALIVEAGRAVSAAVSPPDDIHASAEYRRALAGTLTERALMRAGGGAR